MTVKDLIQQLKQWDPNAEVRIGRYGGPIDLSIKGITVYILSPSENQDYVYLRGEGTYYGAEMIPQANTIENTINIGGVQTRTFSGGLQKN